MSSENEPGFDTVVKGGFHITFENGWTASIQFKAGNYCEHHHDFPLTPLTEHSLYRGRSKDAEVAAWNPASDNLHQFEGWDDTVKGWQSPAEVLQFLNMVASMPCI